MHFVQGDFRFSAYDAVVLGYGRRQQKTQLRQGSLRVVGDCARLCYTSSELLGWIHHRRHWSHSGNIVMAAASYSWPPAGNYVLLLSFRSSFFAAYSPRSLGRSSPNFTTCLVTQIYKIRSEIWVSRSRQIWQPQNVTISARLRPTSRLVANISGTQQDIINRKTALWNRETRAQADLIPCPLVHKRREIGPEFTPTQNQLFQTLIWQEAQLPLRNRASATYFFVAKLISIAHSCI